MLSKHAKAVRRSPVVSGERLARDTTEYVIDGVRWPSVTEVLEIAGLSDIEGLRAAVGDEVIDRAAERGKAVHYACELIDRGQEIAVSDSILGYVRAYER